MKSNDQKERASFLSSLDNYLERGLDQMALSQTVERLNRFPFDADLKIAYCDILMKMGKNDEAFELIHELENTFLKMSRIYAHLGDIHREKGLHQEAISFYRKFLFLNPNSNITDEIREKMNVLLNSSNMEAEEVTEDNSHNIHQIAPHFRTLTMADLYIRQGHLDTAADILKEILTNEPGNKNAAERLQQITGSLKNEVSENRGNNIDMVIAELEKWMKNISRIKNNAHWCQDVPPK